MRATRGRLFTVTERSPLAEFLRARREQLQPTDVGLRDSGRRRTPGLRREEVATLAGVSVDYLMRLEQGRDLNPSASVVLALATALRLTETERMHLGKLAAISSAPQLCPSASPLLHQVEPMVQTIIDRLDPTPAFVIGPASHVLASNRSWRSLVEPLGVLATAPYNLARFVLADPRAREVFPDWERVADEQVSRLRAASIRWGDDDTFAALLDELGSLPAFTERWSTHSVAEKRRGTKRLAHPKVGELRLAYEVLLLPDEEQRLITWLPADEATEAAMRIAIDDLPASPARLRVVREA